ncbi:hypothetical protein PsorP6_004854 [Peronosclerospora sorghi]|uniref:Uncharacterized protein n=1 Tax=Peronosclerospora sorghi TaxID=230839 RepID=A0ACC0W4A7_9STRA|nr:hypothetical protein PsorP6_004854 [Peronosclerospora sorghi]
MEWANAIRTITNRMARRRRRKDRQLHQAIYGSTEDRDHLLKIGVEEIRQLNMYRKGRKLQRSVQDVRWLFCRTAIWESNQNVTRIDIPDGNGKVNDLPITEKFVHVWRSILGNSHRRVDESRLSQSLDTFMRIPASRRVNAEDNANLMMSITEDDIHMAI